jgi:hypothetical protein
MDPVREPNNVVTAKTLQERVISTLSVPTVILSDNALCFAAHEFKVLCFGLGVKHVNITRSFLILSG